MSSGMPELGSKISLISKADIRYEGRLFTVDPQECTIALASVRSFGTEDRETQFPVAPQSQVYDYILFRGSDIKDIRVVNNVSSLPNDPAIMQLSVPPSLGPVGGVVAPPYQPAPFSHPVVGPAQYPQYHPMGMAGMRPAQPMKQPSELAHTLPHPVPHPVSQADPHVPDTPTVHQAKDQGSMLELIGGGSAQSNSRSGTPAPNMHRKSPTSDQGTQVGSVNQKGGDMRRGPPGRPQHQQQHPQQNQQQHLQQHPQQQLNQHHNQQLNQQHNQQNNQQYNQQQQPQQRRPNSRNRNAMHQAHHNNQNQQLQQQQRQQQPPFPHELPQQQPQVLQPAYQANQQNQALQQNQRSGGWRGGRGMRGGRGGRGGYGRPVPPAGTGIGQRAKNTLKFDNDYDFEQANTEFEELRTQLAKTKISDDVTAKTEVTSESEKEKEKKEDSGNETGTGEAEPDEGEDYQAYDKAKSFFDNISCEAVERSKGRSQRTDWRTERKLNSETFGVAAPRRGMWRGRGGWRGAPPQYNNMQGWRGGNQRGMNRPRQPPPASQHQPRRAPSATHAPPAVPAQVAQPAGK